MATSQPTDVILYTNAMMKYNSGSYVFYISKPNCPESLYAEKTEEQAGPDPIYNDPMDALRLKIVDLEGLNPGQSFSYHLTVENDIAGSITYQSLNFKLSNSFNAKTKKHEFEVTFQPNPGHDNSIQKNTSIFGRYALSKTKRTMQIEIELIVDGEPYRPDICPSLGVEY